VNDRPLIETNPYLKDPSKRQILLYTAVSSSTAMEGVYIALSKSMNRVKATGKSITLSQPEVSGESQF
jgi:hypothetical protein